jgi:hypothetical protein
MVPTGTDRLDDSAGSRRLSANGFRAVSQNSRRMV